MKTNDEIKKEISETMEELSWVVEGGDAHDLQDACDKAYACLADTLSLIERLKNDVSFYRNISVLSAKTCDMQNELIKEIKTDRARLSEDVQWMEVERDDFKRTIQQLQVDLEDMTTRYKIADDCAKKKGEMNEKLYAELSAVKAERDELLNHLETISGCLACKHADTEPDAAPCNGCIAANGDAVETRWQWCGTKMDGGTSNEQDT